MKLIETKGDVRFYKNEEGTLFQQLFDREIEAVVDGEIQFRLIEKDNNYEIRYQLNGVNGFSVWSKSGINYQDDFWTLLEAQNYILETLPRTCNKCGKLVYFEHSPSWEMCTVCEGTFCSDCIDWGNDFEHVGTICENCSKGEPTIIYAKEGMLLVDHYCEKCQEPLRYNEWVDGQTCCEDCLE